MRHPRFRILALTACALALASCASGSGSGSRRGPADRLSAEELEEWASQDLFNIIQRLRPTWLQVRAPVTAQGRPTIAVILDGQRQQGSVELLRDLKAGDVQDVRFMNARDATTRFGTDMTAGAILVTTKR